MISDPRVSIGFLPARGLKLEGNLRGNETVVEQIDGAVYSDLLFCLVECKIKGLEQEIMAMLAEVV